MRIKILVWMVAASMLFAQCTKNYEEKNTDPNQQSPASFNAEYFLAAGENEYKGAITGYEGSWLFQAGWAQINAAASTGYLSNMDKYVESSNTSDYSGRSWNDCYRAAGYANAIIQKHAADADKVNLVSAATVLKVLALHYITDIYGDIPYKNALQGFDGKGLGVVTPAYDKQQDVYTGLLSELDGALTKFDASKAAPQADLIYGGNIAKWKKFGYSLMLRMAMRLTKVDAATAKTYAEKAFAGGVFTSNADNAYMKAENKTGHGSENARVTTLAGDIEYIRWSKPFIDYLKSTNDPRLSVISEVVDQAAAVDIAVTPTTSNTSASAQVGLPSGYTTTTGTPFFIGNHPNYPGAVGAGGTVAEILGKYSRPRRALYYNLDGPVFIITYAEVSLMLAEAKFRGWNVGSLSAQGYYQQGIAAALGTFATFDANAGAIDASTISSFASSQTLTAGQELSLINTQYWVTTGSFYNWAEAWNNWRRSGYPVLTKVTFPGQFATDIPRRQMYPTTEPSANAANYAAALSGISTGTDSWVGRVWWDK
jgi:hypothetical protein